jgi:uncharacterized protein YndB with AHSA1/START domain
VKDDEAAWSRRDVTRALAALGAAALTGCGRAELAARNPSPSCRIGATPPLTGDGPGFPCWPRGMTPSECDVFVENEGTVSAPIEATWAWLTTADLWSRWFSKASNVRFEQGGPRLEVGTILSWDMVGATIRVTVTRADAPRMLTWEGGADGVHAYHAWLLIPDGARSTRILTVETERGTLPTLFASVITARVRGAHDAWLADLARVAPTGLPGG